MSNALPAAVAAAVGVQPSAVTIVSITPFSRRRLQLVGGFAVIAKIYAPTAQLESISTAFTSALGSSSSPAYASFVGTIAAAAGVSPATIGVVPTTSSVVGGNSIAPGDSGSAAPPSLNVALLGGAVGGGVAVVLIIAFAIRSCTSRRQQAQAIAKMTTVNAPPEDKPGESSPPPDRHAPHLRLAVIRPPAAHEGGTGARTAFGPLPASATTTVPTPKSSVIVNPLMAATLPPPPPPLLPPPPPPQPQPAASDGKLTDDETESTTTPVAPKSPAKSARPGSAI